MPTEPRRPPDRGAVWLGLLILYVVWGSTYLGIAVAVETIPPFLMAAVRFAIAGTVLMAWSLLRARGSFVAPSRREWRDTIIVGTLLLGGGMGMVAFGEQTIPSGIAALLIAMMPVWVAIFGRIFLGERLPRIAAVGIVVGFVGVAILVGPTILGQTGALDPIGLAALIISPIAWSLGSLYASHRATLPRQPLVATGTQMLAGGAVLALMAGVTGEFGRFDPAAVSDDSIGGSRLPDGRRQPARLHRVRLAPAGGAAAAHRDLRLREPGRGRDPGRGRAQRADRRAHARGRRRDHRRGRADRDRARPDDGAGVQAVGRSQPWAGHGSHLSGRSSRYPRA